MGERIVLNMFPSFGPQVPFKLHVSRSDTLGTVRHVLSEVYPIGVHGQIAIVANGRELGCESDERTLEELGLAEGSPLTVGVYTPYLPLHSQASHVVEDVEVQEEALRKCFQHALKMPDVEVAGVLIGKQLADGMICVGDSAAISEGDQRSVTLDPAKVALIASHFRGSENFLVGWYHSHIKFGALMSGVDLRLQSAYQQLYDKTVALVLDPRTKSRKLYRAGHTPRKARGKRLYLPGRMLLDMDFESVTLTTTLETAERAEIVSFTGSLADSGDLARFEITVRNIGSLPLSYAKVSVRLTSPDGKEFVDASIEDVNVPVGETEKYSVTCEVPKPWTSGNAVARVGIRSGVNRSWLCRMVATYIPIVGQPVHKAKIGVATTSRNVSIGQPAAYVVYVKNDGNVRDDIEVDWDLSALPKFWQANLYDGKEKKSPPFILSLVPGAKHNLVLEVIPLPKATAGIPVPVTLKAKPVQAGVQERDNSLGRSP